MKSSFPRLAEWKIPFKKKFLIAGPCSVESEQQILRTAIQLSKYEVTALRGGIWKPRTHPGSFEGIGAPALKWLKDAGNAVRVPVTTEVANPHHVELCLKAGIDILWVGARTTTNPFAVQEIADALRGVDVPVMIKNPMNPDLELWLGAIERVGKAGVRRIMAIHRGFFAYTRDRYRNQPIWRIPIELRRQMPDMPLLCDPSHLAGDRRLVFAIAQEAMDFLFDGLMIEVHCSPTGALSDAQQQITPAYYGRIIKTLRYASPGTDGKSLPQEIALLRKEIDVIDGNIIGLLAKRMDFVRQIGIWKRDHNVSSFQPVRWRQVLARSVRKSGQKHLSESFVSDIFAHIHEEALRIQEGRRR